MKLEPKEITCHHCNNTTMVERERDWCEKCGRRVFYDPKDHLCLRAFFRSQGYPWFSDRESNGKHEREANKTGFSILRLGRDFSWAFRSKDIGNSDVVHFITSQSTDVFLPRE